MMNIRGRIRLLPAMVLGLTAAILLTADSAAGATSYTPKTIVVEVGPDGNPVFSPYSARAHLGDTVEWNWASSNHSSTDGSGLDLWDSGALSEGATFSRAFTAAGTYHYLSTPDQGQGMTGVVRVPMEIHPKTGVAGETIFRITWATSPPPPGIYFEVQGLGPGGAKFRDFFGTPSLQESIKGGLGDVGNWYFRARLLNTATGAHTNWSPIATLTVS